MSDDNQTVDETAINLGQRIRILRERRNLSQRALAESSGLSRNTLSLLERGRSSPTVSTLKRIAMAMGLDLDSFFDSSKYVNIVHTKSDQRPHGQLLGISMADLGVGMLDQVMTTLMLQLGPKGRSGPPRM